LLGVRGDRSVTKYTTTPKDPRIKPPGVFCCSKGIMNDTDKKLKQEAEWYATHQMSKQDVERLIADKTARALAYRNAQKREVPREVR